MNSTEQRILIATDGSPSAYAALAVALKFPWSAQSKARAVVARFPWLRTESQAAQIMLDSAVQAAVNDARTRLRRRWRDVQVTVVHEAPTHAILGEAQRVAADVVVLGWRGHGTFHRLLAGSVSRTVAAKARCAVLVVRQAPAVLRRFVVAYDGSANADKAVDFLTRLQPRRGSRVVVVSVVQPLLLPASSGRLPRKVRMELRQLVAEKTSSSCG